MKHFFKVNLTTLLLLTSAQGFAISQNTGDNYECDAFLLPWIPVSSCGDKYKDINHGLNPYSEKLKSWSKSDKWGNNRYINSSYKLWGDISYETIGDIPYATYFGSKNSVDAKIFKSFNILKADGEAAANFLSTSDTVMLKSKTTIFGKKIWDLNKTWKPDETVELWSTKDSEHKERYIAKKEFKKGQTFFIGPVPFTVEGKAKGEIGIKGHIKANIGGISPSINAEFGPYAKVDGIVNGSVDAFLARGGVENQVNLIGVDGKVKGLAEVKAAEYAKLKFELPITVKSLDGKVAVTGDVAKLKCKWLINCKREWKRIAEKVLVQWKGFTWKWYVFQKEKKWGNKD